MRKNLIEDYGELQIYLNYAYEIKDWMKLNNNRYPQATSTDVVERRLGALMGKIKREVVFPYFKIENSQEKQEYETKYPEVVEIINLLGESKRKVVRQPVKNEEKKPKHAAEYIPSFLKKSRELKKIVEENGYVVCLLDYKKEEGKRIKTSLGNIKNSFVYHYLSLDSLAERKKFEEKHPEIKEVLENLIFVETNFEASWENYIKIINDVKKWIINNEAIDPPSKGSKNQEERKLANYVKAINYYIINPYLSLKNDNDRKQYAKENPQILNLIELVEGINKKDVIRDEFNQMIQNALDFKSWMQVYGSFPRWNGGSKEESKLYCKYKYIKNVFLKRFKNCSEEERLFYEEKYPEMQELINIVKWIEFVRKTIGVGSKRRKASHVEKTNESKIPKRLKNARDIKEWMEKNKRNRPPCQRSEDEEEKGLAIKLNNLKSSYIKPYLAMTEEEKAKYLEKHCELIEIMTILYDINKKGQTQNQRELAREIEKELRRYVYEHVDTNQETRKELFELVAFWDKKDER